MNIVASYPTSLPMNTANIATDAARRDNVNRQVITPPNGSEAGARERGVSSENDKSKAGQQSLSEFETNLRNAEGQQKIGQRQGQQGDSEGKDQEKEKEKQQLEKQFAQAKQQLAKAEQQEASEVQQLKARDQEVRTHEQAHAAAGGQYAGSPTYEFKRGPDGNRYAVGGEVSISVSAVAGDPAATIQKMQQVRAAALAPAEPSGQDRSVASQASAQISQAQAEAIQQKADELKEQTEAREQADDTETVSGAQASQPADAAQRAPQTDFAAQIQGQVQGQSQSQQTLGRIFGVDDDNEQTAANGIAGFSQSGASLIANDDRDSQVLARASKIQSFYSAATVPHQRNFSQFA